MSAAVAGTTFRPTPSYTTLRDVTAGTFAIRRLARAALATPRLAPRTTSTSTLTARI